MRCCGRETTAVELQVAGQPYEMRRCGECDSSYWTRDGVNVDLDEVTSALREETEAEAAAIAARRAERADAQR